MSHDNIRAVPTACNDTVLSKWRGRGATDRANSPRLLSLLSRVGFNRSVESQLNGEIEIAMVHDGIWLWKMSVTVDGEFESKGTRVGKKSKRNLRTYF